MRLNLNEIIYVPGAEMPFSYELDLSDTELDGINGFLEPLIVNGCVKNRADVLELHADVEAKLMCGCARCMKPLRVTKRIKVNERLNTAAGDDAGENSELFRPDGDELDVDEVIRSVFILELDARFLCSEECKGLCPACGTDLNKGPCGCKKEVDPRLAALEALLEDE